jgi:hypothetical protein
MQQETIPESEQLEPVTIPAKLTVTGCKPLYQQKDEMKIRVSWSDVVAVKRVGVAIIGSKDEYIFGSHSDDMEIKGTSVDYSVILNLGPGRYYLTAVIYDELGEIIEVAVKAWEFLIHNDHRDFVAGLTRMDYAYSSILKNSQKKIKEK